MKIRTRKDGSFKMHAQNEHDSEVLYMFLSGGKHSLRWFTSRIDKRILRGKDEVMVVDKDHANVLFQMQNQSSSFSDVLPPVQECDATAAK